MQLKETGAGEVTVWLAEMLATIGGTDEEEAAQRNEREGTMLHLVQRACTLLHSTLLVHSITDNCMCTSQYYCCLSQEVQVILYIQ